MQIGIAHLVAFFVGVAVLIGGAFAAGTKWNVKDADAQTAAVESALDNSATTSEEFIDEDIPAPTGAPLYKVLRVVDGDTIVIEKDGKSESVRMIGVDTPEINDSRTGVQCFAKEASEKTKSLVTGKNVRLEMDTSQGERDKYKRLLGYVFIENGTFLNLALIKGGYAHEYTYDGAYKYQKEFKAAQVEAKEAEAGLWSPDACPTPPAVRASKSTSKSSSASQTAAAASTQPVQQPQQPPPPPAPATTTPEPPKQEVKKEESKPESPPPPEPQQSQSSSNSDIVCSTNTYNCTDFKTKQEAQKVYDQCGGVENDIHQLDRNKDGGACDSLP